MYEVKNIINEIKIRAGDLDKVKIQVEVLGDFIKILRGLRNTSYVTILKSLKPISMSSFEEDLIDNIRKVYNGIVSSILGYNYINILAKCYSGINDLSSAKYVLEELGKILEKLPYFEKIKNTPAIYTIKHHYLCVLPNITDNDFKILFEINKDSEELKKYITRFLGISEKESMTSIMNFVEEHPPMSSFSEYITNISNSLKHLLKIVKSMYHNYGTLNDLLNIKFDVDVNSFILRSLVNILNKLLEELKKELISANEDPINRIKLIHEKTKDYSLKIGKTIENFQYRIEKILLSVNKLTQDPETRKDINILKNLVNNLSKYEPLNKDTYNYFVKDLINIDNILSTILNKILGTEEKRLYEELQRYMIENNIDEIHLDDNRVLEIIKDNFVQFIELCRKGLFVCLVKS